jgi:O-antigen/teichoic acid export membrane protein
MTQVRQLVARPATQTQESRRPSWLPSLLPASEARLLSEGLWITGGHALAAVAALIGVRLTTELAPASLYGAFVLLNGALALLQGVLLQPLAQAALRYYPEFASLDSSAVLRKHLAGAFARRWGWSLVAVALVCASDAVTFQFLSTTTWLLLAGGLGLEAWRSIEITLSNAARRQGAYAALYAADGIARAAGVVGAAWTLGPSLESLLFGQCIGVLVVLALFRVLFGDETDAVRDSAPPKAETTSMADGMCHFAAPLLWGPILGWVSGLADRYVIGGMLGLAQAGVYAAACGLVSRPMLMIGAVSDATLRQVLYSAAARGETATLRRTLAVWVTANVLAGGLLGLVLVIFSGSIMSVLLAADYREDAATVVPWIAAGYVLVLLDQAVGRFLYARGRTNAVVGIQAASATLAVLIVSAAVWWNGMVGAAMAAALYFGLQLTLTTAVALRVLRGAP